MIVVQTSSCSISSSTCNSFGAQTVGPINIVIIIVGKAKGAHSHLTHERISFWVFEFVHFQPFDHFYRPQSVSALFGHHTAAIRPVGPCPAPALECEFNVVSHMPKPNSSFRTRPYESFACKRIICDSKPSHRPFDA